MPILENPFSNTCYPREISLYLPAPAVVSLSRLENEIHLVPQMFLAHGIQFKSGQVSLAGVFVL